jgi:hypothetical protein
MQAENDLQTADEQSRELTPKEHAAILALLEQPSIRKAAEAAGIGEATLFRWLQKQDFRRAYLDARSKVVNQTMARIQQLTSEAPALLSELMKDKKQPGTTRLAALRTVLDNAVKGIELDYHDIRLAEIEESLVQVGALKKGERL